MPHSPYDTDKNNKDSSAHWYIADEPGVGLSDQNIWNRRWFQICLGVIVVLAVAALVLPTLGWFIYQIRSVLLPILVAFGLAYAVNPLVSWLEKYHVPRRVSAIGLIVLVFIAVAALAVYVLPLLIDQISSLVNKIPVYWQEFLQWTGINPADLIDKARKAFNLSASQVSGSNSSAPPSHQSVNVDWSAVSSAVLAGLDIGYTLVSSIIGIIGYLILAMVILLFCFFFFVWKFDQIINWFVSFIPVSKRENTLLITQEMDRCVSGFIHGRLFQAVELATVLSIGWGIVGVPYWLLLGILAGILNLIPYVTVISWPLAIGLTWLNAVSVGGGGFSFMSVLIAPSIVYMIGQGLDSWVVEPLIQGKATDMDPLTVLIVVLVGGSLAGLLGMILAIPLAACIKIFSHKVALPKLRKIINSMGEKPV